MKQREFIGSGSCSNLPEILKQYRVKNAFLVTGKNSFRSSGAEKILQDSLSSIHSTSFSDFPQSFKAEDLYRALDVYRKNRPDCLIAVGGGSVIDIAKLIRYFDIPDVCDIASLRKKIESNEQIPHPSIPPLIAIPTTSGSGSEATQFGVVYIGHTKYSISDPAILPDVAIVDSLLTLQLPPYLSASTGMDALSQAIESYWSVASTEQSKEFALQAIRRILPALRNVVLNPDLHSKEEMAIGAHLAGKAINFTRTTAPHAISYPFTSIFGVPHGHAVALTLGAIFLHNANATPEDCEDPRGIEMLQKTMNELCELLGCSSPDGCHAFLRNLMTDIGLETRLRNLGLRTENDVEMILDYVNAERLKNNPRKLSRNTLKDILQTLF